MNAAIAPMPSAPRYSEQKLVEQRAHEPSMEEILASIRRIIADDSTLPLVPRPTTEILGKPAPIAVSEGMLEAPVSSTQALADAMPVHIQASHIDMDAITAALESSIFMVADPVGPAQSNLADRVGAQDPVLVSQENSSEPKAPPAQWQRANVVPEVSAPLAGAARPASASVPEPSVLVSPLTDAAVSSSFQALATTMFVNDSDMVENLTREMLRPMLKTWLDDNLPMMVERLVRIEIERVARGGR